MADIAKAYVQIIPSAEGIKGGITQVLSGEAVRAGQSAGQKISASLKKAIVAAGIGKILSDTVSASLKAGAALQQSFGGLETLYGDAADAAKQYALAAAEAGIDANTYAEQAVSFGAALKQAFGGDTQAAMEAANMAIMDMADNSAKMGTDIQSIQTAYQGFAKQNYSMLDNLKLGYGGTRSEMERLLKDASKLSGVEYDISNLGDVYEAIHVIQEELGVAGVAADEAKATLSGSANAVKAAWQNVLASMSMGLDMSGPVTQLMQSTGALIFNNLIPMIGNIIKSVPQIAMTAIQGIMPTIQTGLNALLSGQAGTTIATLTASFMERIPELLEVGAQLLANIAQGIYTMLPQIIEAAAGVIAQFAATVGEHLPDILQKGIELLGELASGIIQAIPDLLQKIPEVYDNIKQKFSEFDWLSIGGDIIKGIANGIANAAGDIAKAAKEAAQRALDAAKNALGISSPSKVMEKEVGRYISEGIAVGIEKYAYKIDDAVEDVTDLGLGEFASGRITATPYTRTSEAGFTQNITVNSPTALMPSEVARQTRNATQQMALAMSGVY